VNDACIWTSIYIDTLFREPNVRLDHFLSLLGMQLDRTADLLLDVDWMAMIGEEFFVATLRLIRQKAPFSRWRTLRLVLPRGPNQSIHWSTSDAFTNLQSLSVWHRTDTTILRIIDGTITSHLDVLDLTTWSASQHPSTMVSFPRSFTHISSLLLGSLPSTLDTPFLPANVVSLQLDEAGAHPFPHIQTYMLKACLFLQTNTINLGNVTTLIVRGPIRIACEVLLPALLQLTLSTIQMDPDGRIEAPALNTLSFMRTETPKTYDLSHTAGSLQVPGYLLSPNTSISADSYLPSRALLNLLVKSPEVTHATLGFNDWADAQVVLEKVVGFRTQTDSTEHESLCPRLSELRLDFGWTLSAPSTSKQWLVERLKARRDSGTMSPLSIYVGWKGEGTYVLLTGD
jgi:hypothetical protein